MVVFRGIFLLRLRAGLERRRGVDRGREYYFDDRRRPCLLKSLTSIRSHSTDPSNPLTTPLSTPPSTFRLHTHPASHLQPPLRHPLAPPPVACRSADCQELQHSTTLFPSPRLQRRSVAAGRAPRAAEEARRPPFRFFLLVPPTAAAARPILLKTSSACCRSCAAPTRRRARASTFGSRTPRSRMHAGG